jgi:hypothetical protein
MWWEQHWVELATLVSVVGAFVRMEMTLRYVAEREREHHELVQKRLDAHSRRIEKVEDDQTHLLNECPVVREKRLRRGGAFTE